MWVRRTAIRPVPAYAQVPQHALEAVRESLADDDDDAREQLDEGFERFERDQPALASFIAEALSRPLDETALALGYFLSLSVWLAFEHAHGDEIGDVDEAALRTTQELLTLDEQLRRADPGDPLDSDDVISMHQPHLLEYVHEHIDATIEAQADSIDVDDVHLVYRVVLVEIMALSYAVGRPAGYPVSSSELLA